MPSKPSLINWFICKYVNAIQLLLIALIFQSLLNVYYNELGVRLCNAAATTIPIPSSPPLEISSDSREVALKRVAVVGADTATDSNGVNNLTRQHEGDVFYAKGKWYTRIDFDEKYEVFYC